MSRALVAGVDSSTQATKVVVRDMATGELVRHGSAPHPPGAEVDPEAWWTALGAAADAAGGLDDVSAIAVAAQQHGMVCLDDDGAVVRPALLWNDTRSADAASALVNELGGSDVGPAAWAAAVGSVPVASFTVTKLRWLAEREPDNARRAAAVCLPHDWLTWRLAGGGDLDGLRTDRSDASGTGYWSAAGEAYRLDLLTRAFGRPLHVPEVLAPQGSAGRTADGLLAGAGPGGGVLLGAGAGDNAGAALGLGADPGDVVVSVGTSGVVAAVSDVPSADPSGIVAGFADATGRHLPLACTLNAARVLDTAATLLGVDHAGLSDLALSAPPGAGGLVTVPYLEGERTPNRPLATGSMHGLTSDTFTPACLARAAVEGLLCGLADALDELVAMGARIDRVFLVGGGARSAALRAIAPAILGRPVAVPEPGEHVADGAARQAAWALTGEPGPPAWSHSTHEVYEAEPAPQVRARYAEARDLILNRLPD